MDFTLQANMFLVWARENYPQLFYESPKGVGVAGFHYWEMEYPLLSPMAPQEVCDVLNNKKNTPIKIIFQYNPSPFAYEGMTVCAYSHPSELTYVEILGTSIHDGLIHSLFVRFFADCTYAMGQIQDDLHVMYGPDKDPWQFTIRMKEEDLPLYVFS